MKTPYKHIQEGARVSKTQEDIPKPSWARIAGFACYQGFVYAAFYLGTNHQMQLGPFSVERAELLLTLAFMVAAFIGERLAPDVAERALSRSGTLAAFAAFMSAGAAISAAPGTTAAEVAAEGLLIGAPMALTLMAWGKTPAAPRRHRNFRRYRHCRGMLLRAVVCARGNRFGTSVRAAIRGRGVHGNRPTRAKRHVGNDAPHPH